MSPNQTVLVADFLNGVSDAARLTITNAGRRIDHLECKIGTMSTAYIDWTDSGSISATVYFPSSLDILGHMSRALADQWAAYWLHEIFHALYTSKDAWQEAVRDGISDMVNALEDVRIERKALDNNIARNTKSLLEKLTYEKLSEASNKKPIDPNKNIAGILCYAGREKLLGYNLHGFLSKTLSMLTPANTALILDTWNKLALCTSTYDVNALAREVLDAIAKSQPQQPPQPSQATEAGNDSQDGETSQETDQPTGKPSEDDGEPCENGDTDPGEDNEPSDDEAGYTTGDDGEPSEADEAEDGDETSEGSGKGSNPDGDNSTPNDTSKPGGDGADSTPAQEQENTLDTNLQPESATPKKEKAFERKIRELTNAIGSQVMDSANKVRINDRSNDSYSSSSVASTANLPHSNKLDREIASLLRSPEKRGKVHNQTSGRLSRRSLTRATLGKLDVFAQRWEVPGNETVVGVLVDMSSSMNSWIYETEKAVRMIARAIERSGTKSIIAGFKSRTYGVSLEVIKPITKKAVACHNANAILNVDGGTPMSAAIVAMARLLKGTQATRRVILCLTDGACDHGSTGTMFASNYAEKLGVEVLALGIGCDPTGAFPEGCAITASNATSLGVNGLGLLGKRLKEASPI